MRSAFFLVLVLVASASFARADVIHRPACDPGWEAQREGHGMFCAPIVCTADTDCAAGTACREVARCWLEERVPSGRVRPDPSLPPPTTWVASDSLCVAGECRSPERCRRARECVSTEEAETVAPAPPPTPAPAPSSAVAPAPSPAVAPSPAPAPAASSGLCSVRASARSPRSAIVVVLLASLAAIRRRRRIRRRRHPRRAR